MNLINKMKFVLNIPKSNKLAKEYSMPIIMEDDETLDYILQNGCSIARFGDGEFNLIRGVGIKFQEYSVDLCKKLEKVAAVKKDNVLICLPNIFKSLSHFTPDVIKWWKRNLMCTRGFWYKLFRASNYGDANISRFYVESADKNREKFVIKLKQIWEGKRLLIVEGAKSRIGMGNDLFANATCIKRVLCPSSNAFNSYSKILSEIEKQIATNNFDMLICALGPTATVLCYDIADKIQALDLGHIDIEYEWFLSKAKTKQAVKNKSVTEVTDSCDDNVDQVYVEQILSVIS